MSFILDALKKSENERQRQAGPALATVPTGVRNTSGGKWLMLVVVAMAVVIAVLIVILVRRDAPEQAVSAVAPVVRPEPVAQPAQTDAKTAIQPPPTVTDHDREVRSLRGEVQKETTDIPVDNPVVTTRQETRQPLTNATGPAARSPSVPAPQRNATTEVSGMPTARDLVLQGVLAGPPMHLDLLIYSENKDRRAVFIDGKKYKQGDRIRNGPRIHEIVPQGAVLDNGSQLYLLDPD
jgi:general secretion pathway protein B